MCKACAAAAVNPDHGTYVASCHGCSARLIANGQAFWRAKQADELTSDYRALLESTFGAEWKTWHAEVKRWAGVIDRHRDQSRALLMADSAWDSLR